MPDVNYYLKKPNPTNGKSLIYLQFKFHGYKFVYSFRQTVAKSDWNAKKQRLKSNATTTEDGKYYLNDLLDTLKVECLTAYNKEVSKGIPTPKTLKSYLDNFLHQNNIKEKEQNSKPTLFGLIERFVNGEIKHQGRDKKPNTIKKYKTVKGQLQELQAKRGIHVDFASIDLNFFYTWVSYLKDVKKQKQNSIAKSVKTLKVFMNEAVDLGYTNNLNFKHRKFSVAEEDVESVYLSESEILKLYRYDLTLNKRLEQVRDLFCFGCCVGLRYSDYANIQPENIIEIDGEKFIKVITKKTEELVIIPCNPLVIEIFQKYTSAKNNLPRSVSSVKFNEYIKEAAREAGLTETGRLLVNPELPLYKAISSHTARRSFATNYYLQGFPSIELMRITGHRSEKSFMKYIKVTKQESAKRLSAHIKKNWGQYLLKVA